MEINSSVIVSCVRQAEWGPKVQDSETRLTLKHKELKYKDCTEKIVGNTNQENKAETSKPTGDTAGDHDNGQ